MDIDPRVGGGSGGWGGGGMCGVGVSGWEENLVHNMSGQKVVRLLFRGNIGLLMVTW